MHSVKRADGLLGVLQSDGIALTLLHCVGPLAASQLGSASSGNVCAVIRAWPTLCKLSSRGICFVGGRDDGAAEYFDVGTQSWHLFPTLPCDSRASWPEVAAELRGQVFSCGFAAFGASRTDLGWSASLDPYSGAWESHSPPHGSQNRGEVTVLKGKVYICGGVTSGGQALKAASRFDPLGSMTWETLRSMTEKRCGAMGGVLGGRLYICGGSKDLSPTSKPLSSVECYDPSTGIWQRCPPMLHAVRGAAVASVRGCLYLCGGGPAWKDDVRDSWTTVQSFDNAIAAWHQCTPMREGRRAAAAAAVFGMLYVCGGVRAGEALNSGERYEPLTDVWESLPTMHFPRISPVAVSFPLWASSAQIDT